MDRAALLLNGKRSYPPVALRRQNGPLNTFERVAGEYVAYLVTLAGLAPDSHVLDVGCGSGAMPILLRERLGPDGRYTGFEVDRPTVEWCQRHLADDRFRFFHHDYWNATYNPAGTRELAWPVEDASVDVVLLKSIFTHMLPEDVDFYLAEIGRVLRPGGKALVTAFLYEQAGDAVGGRHSFPHSGAGYRYANPASPESAIALELAPFTASAGAAGLKAEILPGLWRPRLESRPYAYQDMVILSAL
ncbi:class I SAM-dependent methyltransferase [Streptomyces sp. NBC_01236]|uniref:class I SAM-dependent methyltransferase n=1 Tax=Streptomyces sp. NBC_01236 TaxID=2903789 RepID=UPI002E156D7A|nr:class I SAM-dependent methyltransferase [Streptomyces sp. NBC_01236]